MNRGTCSAAVDSYSYGCVTAYRKLTEARVVLPSIPTVVLVSQDTREMTPEMVGNHCLV